MTPGIANRPSTRLLKWLKGLVLLLWLSSGGALADAQEQRLVNVGLRLFPAVVAASQRLDNLDSASTIDVDVVYQNNLPYARDIAARLEQLGEIKGHPLRVRTVSIAELTARDNGRPFALFLAQRTGTELQSVITYSLYNDVLSFSPFSSDVEEGVLAGVFISDRILPYINLRTLSSVSFGFKPFFLKVAQPYAQ